jgi:putative endopeptidase
MQKTGDLKFRTSFITRGAGIEVVLAALLIGLPSFAQVTPSSPDKQNSASIPAAAVTTLSMDWMDLTADPCSDFYRFACGNFATSHPIPADQATINVGLITRTKVSEQLSGILEKAATQRAGQNSNEQKIGNYYEACMNTDAIEQVGLSPIQPLLKAIDALVKEPEGRQHLPELIGRLEREGFAVFFNYGSMADLDDAGKHVAYIDRGNLGLPDPDYYLRSESKDQEVRRKYVDHVARMLVLGGVDPTQAAQEARDVLAMETTLAQSALSETERRKTANRHHILTLAAFEASAPGLDFRAFLTAVHAGRVDTLNESEPAYDQAMVRILREASLTTLAAYLRYQLLTAYADELPKRFDDENFDFYLRTLRGQQQQAPRRRRCAKAVESALGEALAQVYIEQYFASANKAKTLELVQNVERAMDRDFDQIGWMSLATKERARAKLHAVTNKIGYPDRFRDYSALTVRRDTAAENLLRANEFEEDRDLGKIGKPTDRSEWFRTPTVVDAFYYMSTNDMYFPAAILQAPLYDAAADDASNYGHIGSMIGHELTHAFDNQGKDFGPTGNLENWWTADDLKSYKERTQCLVDEYSAFVPVGDLHVDGRRTLGENTADNGGLVLSYLAYLEQERERGVDPEAKTDGFTGSQRFYLAFAQGWCENARPENIRTQVLTDTHTPRKFRVNGSIVNQPAFAPAFSCKAGTPMAPVTSCRVW